MFADRLVRADVRVERAVFVGHVLAGRGSGTHDGSRLLRVTGVAGRRVGSGGCGRCAARGCGGLCDAISRLGEASLMSSSSRSTRLSIPPVDLSRTARTSTCRRTDQIPDRDGCRSHLQDSGTQRVGNQLSGRDHPHVGVIGRSRCPRGGVRVGQIHGGVDLAVDTGSVSPVSVPITNTNRSEEMPKK